MGEFCTDDMGPIHNAFRLFSAKKFLLQYFWASSDNLLFVYCLFCSPAPRLPFFPGGGREEGREEPGKNLFLTLRVTRSGDFARKTHFKIFFARKN